MKERMLTVLVPIKDSDATLVESLPPVNPDNINVIFKYNGAYYRVYHDIHNNTYEDRIVVDREFPEIGNPLKSLISSMTPHVWGQPRQYRRRM